MKALYLNFVMPRAAILHHREDNLGLCECPLWVYFVEKLLRLLGGFDEVDRTKRGVILHDGTAE